MRGRFGAPSGRILIIALLACAGGLAATTRPFLVERVDMSIHDRLRTLVTPPPAGEKIAVVLATEASMKMFKQWPWPRGVHAALLERLEEAKSVVFDVLFPETSATDQDGLLAEAVREAGNVVLAVHITPDDRMDASRLLLPYRELAAAAKGFGVANVVPEPDGVYRDSYLFWIHNGEIVPSLPLAAVLSVREDAPELEETEDGYVMHTPDGPLPLGKDNSFRVHHQEDAVPVYEYADVYYGRVDREAFRDAIVVVGVNTAGASDFLPVGRGRLMPGAVFNANAVHTLLHGWISVDAPRWMSGLAGLLLTLAGAVAGMGGAVRRGWQLTAAAVALWFAAAAWLFVGHRLWLPMTLPALLCVASYFVASIVHLRYLSAAWRVQSLSIDSLLFGDQGGIDARRLTFSDYLESNWPKIRDWSGMELLRPNAGDDDPEVRECLDLAAWTGNEDSADSGPLAAVLREKDGDNRLLIRLPAWEDGARRFAVLGWRGAKSREALKSVAALVVSAAANYQAARETQAKRELFLGVIRLVMRAVDAKDPFTAGHSERVATLSKELAERMGLPQKVVDDVYLSGLLHDVGKIGIPDAILCKPGRLTDEEMEVMRSHPAMGEKLLGEIALPETVMKGIVEHHERLDGKGYPRNLTRDSLSLAGRILKVADVYDALVSKRQYKEPFPADMAYRILSEGAGGEFDAEIVAMVLERPFPAAPPGLLPTAP